MPTDRTPQTLTPKQRKAIEALLTVGEVQGAAQAAGVSKDPIYRWLRQPLFLEAVRAAEAQAIDDLSRVLVRLGRSAAGTLAKAMSDPATPWATKVRSADAVLGRLLQLRELATLEARVTELEKAAGIAEVGR